MARGYRRTTSLRATRLRDTAPLVLELVDRDTLGDPLRRRLVLLGETNSLLVRDARGPAQPAAVGGKDGARFPDEDTLGVHITGRPHSRGEVSAYRNAVLDATAQGVQEYDEGLFLFGCELQWAEICIEVGVRVAGPVI